MKAARNAGEAQLFCGCACKKSFKRRKVRRSCLTAVFPYLKGIIEKRKADVYQRCAATDKGQHIQAKPGKILVN